MSALLERLKERKVVRWVLAYMAGAWVVIEVMSQLGELFAVPLGLQRGVVVLLGAGLLLTAVFAWFHGEEGRQRITGTQILLLAAVLGLTGATLTVVRGRRADSPGSRPASSDNGSTAQGAAVPGPIRTPSSVAILPFADLSPEGDQEYFSAGVAEEVRGVLARVAGLRVASSTSSLSVEDRRLEPTEIGRRLGVNHLVEGSVRKSGARLRIEARLVSVEDGFQVWASRFDADAADIFDVQDSIARAVARAFEIRLAEDTGLLQPQGQTADPLAQDLYMRGRFAWNRRTRESLEEAVRHFQEAVSLDSSYARALVGLADAWAVLGFYDYRPPSEAFPRAKEAALAALAIDSTMAEPWATLGYASLYYDWDWETAESRFREAIRLDPGYPTAHQWYANHLTAMGRFDEALREMRAASELDPLSMIAYAAVGWVQLHARDYEGAVRHLESALERDPDFEIAYLWKGQALEGLGDYAGAEAALRRIVEISGGSAISRSALARLLGVAGRREEAGRLITELDAEARAGYVPSYELSKAYLGVGDGGKALALLRDAVVERSHSVAFLAVDPELAPLRGHPEFSALLREVGLEGVAASAAGSPPGLP